MKGLMRLALGFVILTGVALGVACASGPGARLTATSRFSAASTPSVYPPGPGVADLLANPPAPGQSVEVDAYFSGAGMPALPGSGPRPLPDQVACPDFVGAALTDRPFVPVLYLLNGAHSNHLPDDTPWLIATSPEATRPGIALMPRLPYHGRLRGHLGDPALTHCRSAERIFVVEEVVTTYQSKPADPMPSGLSLPDGYSTWPRHHDVRLGYSVPYPPDWSVKPLVERTVLGAVELRSPQWPDYPVVIRVHSGETHYDQYEPLALPPLLHDSRGFGIFTQGLGFSEEVPGSQRLAGHRVDREPDPAERSISVLFSAHGRTYELSLRYPLGFEAPQPLLTAYTAIVEGFRLDALPDPTPTPPVKQTLGAGPFLGRDEALARARERAGGEVELLGSELVAEAQARRISRSCETFFGHPDGVWLLTVRGQFEGRTRTLRLYLDAATGEQLCGEEVHLDATPWPTLPPGTTATPAPRNPGLPATPTLVRPSR